MALEDTSREFLFYNLTSKEIKKIEEEDKEDLERMKKCEAKGHPHKEIVIVPYQGKGDVTVECSGCYAIYERSATEKERQNYTNTFKLTVDI